MSKKNSSIELLRIVSMFFIVLSHCCAHGLSGIDSSRLINNIVLDIFELGNLGVVIFVIITGYLSVDKKFKLSKILYLEFITITYSIVFWLIYLLLTEDIFNANIMLKSLFPVIFENYWFMTVYISLYLFSPFINFLINSIDKSRLFLLICLCIFSGFIIPTFTTSDLYFNELFQFLTYYCIGAYIRLYVNVDEIYKKAKIMLFFGILCLVASSFVIELLALKISVISSYGTYFLKRNSIFILMLGICVFIIAIKRKEFYCKPVNLISSTMLGVYLIHDNPNVRIILWKNIIDLTKVVDEPWLFMGLLLIAFVIMFVCIFIEFLRMKMLNKLFDYMAKIIGDNLTDKLLEVIKSKGEETCDI